MNEVATIGYERTDGGKFVAALEAADVDMLIDVRMVPFSHKPGFAKAPLQGLLASAGIEYLHLQELGNPKQGRDAAKAGDEATFRSVYTAQMATSAAQRAILRVVDLGRIRRPCLMCFERDHRHCHRGMVAEAVAAHGLSIRHLEPAESEKPITRKKTRGGGADGQSTLF